MGTGGAEEKGSPESPKEENKDAGIKMADISAKVTRVNIEGLTRTKNDIVTKHVKPLFQSTNFEELVKNATQAKLQLERLGLFKRIGIFIDVAHGADASPEGYEVTYNVQELRRVGGGISTLVGTNDGSLLFSARLPNVLGRGEKLTLEYTHGTKQSQGNNLSFSTFLNGNPNLGLSASLFQYAGEFPWSAYHETDRGCSIDFTFPSNFGSHNLKWEGVWRELTSSPKASFEVRENSGHSIKSAIKHTWVRDKRDDRIVPNSGYFIRAAQEIAGIGGDTNFLKNDVELQMNTPLPLGSALQLSLAGGFLKCIQPGNDPRIMDRFFLGGPLTLRGFGMKGIGPSSEGCALGADAYWFSGLHLYTPLPFRPGKGGFGDLFRTHFFVNAGNLSNIDMSENAATNLSKLAEGLRLSYGAGLVLKMGGIARLELNYCVPCWAQPGDALNPGLQFGLGISFL